MDEKKLREVAWVGDAFVRKPIRGIVLRFHGLGDPGVKGFPNYPEFEWADAGGLCVLPYIGPWHWMNREARALTDEIVETLYSHFQLADDVPLILSGGSLGGQASLLYASYAKRPLKACTALHPVTDVKFSFSERPDVARTVYAAFQGYKEDIEALFKEHSPLSRVDKMPRIPYQIIHGTEDVAVSNKAHSEPMAAAMRRHGFDLEYIPVPGMGHHDPLTYPVWRAQIDFVKRSLKA
jgi:dipeptidyl aminopeptidase/acylaminoacyl peptidase